MFQNKPIDNCQYVYAYHRGRWVIVPLFYVPNEAIGDDGCLHHFKIIPLDDQILSEQRPRRCFDRAYERISNNAKETILIDRLKKSEVIELCTNNDIPIGWVTNNYKEVDTKVKTKQRYSRRTKRKFLSLDKDKYKKFIIQLHRIDKRCAIIAEILWFLNGQLGKGDAYITLEELLRLRIHDVDSEEGFSTCISLKRSTPRGIHMVHHHLPEDIWKPLCQLIHPDFLYVFSNTNGGPLLPQNVDRDFNKASKSAGLKGSVSSLSLRPVKVSEHTQFKDVSIKEWNILCKLFPSLETKRGRPPKYDRRVILNWIFYKMRTRISVRDLPSTHPPPRAIHSQYRRWKKNGLFDSILAARQ